MCGLVAIIGRDGREVDLATVERMSRSLKHRGPDCEGHFVSGSVGLGFRRLSILDLTANSDQPMFSPDGRYVIVFNGEIFNYIELRNELEKKGHVFRSTGDTEVLLHAYMEWGSQCLPRLNGMWAFLIYDSVGKTVFGARDRFGEKPLYRYETKEYILFASEIKAILASGCHDQSYNWHAVAKYLYHERLDDGEETFFKDILRIPASHAFTLNMEGEYRESRYWSLDSPHECGIADFDVAFAEILKDAVHLRLRSDVPVGVCLSGGLDSTTIICKMAEAMPCRPDGVSEVKAFCFMSPDYDESRYIGDTLSQTGALLYRLQTSPELLWQKLNTVLYYHDEPVHSLSAVVGFELFGLGKATGVTVMLSGQGADEVIAGYPSYFKNYWFSLLSDGRWRSAAREIAEWCKGHGGNEIHQLAEVVQHYLRWHLSRLAPYRKLKRLAAWRRTRRDPWLSHELAGYLDLEEPPFVDYSLDAALRSSVEVSPLPLYLRVEDRNSMAHSVEARLPFLDYRLVSLSFQLPYTMKMHGKLNKYILRRSMKGSIPESIRTRVDKMGFPVPTSKWLATALLDNVREVVGCSAFRERGIYNHEFVSKNVERHHAGEADVSRRLFSILQMEAWFRVRSSAASYHME